MIEATDPIFRCAAGKVIVLYVRFSSVEGTLHAFSCGHLGRFKERTFQEDHKDITA